MTPEQQRTEIAKACGWASECQRIGGCLHPDKCCCDDLSCDGQEPIPDYLNDLNAMHEAEKVLTIEQRGQYVTILCGATGDASLLSLPFATALQRAEAFILTLNLKPKQP